MKRVAFYLSLLLSPQVFAAASSVSGPTDFDLQFIGSARDKTSLNTLDVEHVLTTFTSDIQEGTVHSFIAVSDESGALKSVIRRSSSTEKAYSAEDFINSEVAVARVSGRDVLLLKCEGCDLNTGGTVTIKYLYNGRKMSYRSMELNLIHSDGVWKLKTEEGEDVKSLRLVARKLFGRTIGIKRIDVNE